MCRDLTHYENLPEDVKKRIDEVIRNAIHGCPPDVLWDIEQWLRAGYPPEYLCVTSDGVVFAYDACDYDVMCGQDKEPDFSGFQTLSRRRTRPPQ